MQHSTEGQLFNHIMYCINSHVRKFVQWLRIWKISNFPLGPSYMYTSGGGGEMNDCWWGLRFALLHCGCRWR